MNNNLNISLTELPKCQYGKGVLLPVIDFAKEGGTPYLKGWFCQACKTSWLTRSGSVVVEGVYPKVN